MATRYGVDAFIGRAKMIAKHKATRNTIFAITLLIIGYLVINEYII